MKKVAFLVWCLVLLCLLEIGIRMVVAPQIDVPHLRVFAGGFYTWYPRSRFTYHNLPKVEPPTADVRINEHGLRGESFPREKPAGETRVLVLGDSYTAGVQLPEDRIFTTLLARELDRRAPSDRHRVVNAGFNGAGTAQELLYFRDQDGARHRASLVGAVAGDRRALCNGQGRLLVVYLVVGEDAVAPEQLGREKLYRDV